MSESEEPKIKKAQYNESSMRLFQGNPLIEALPDYLESHPKMVFEKMEKKPLELANRSSRRQRAQWLIATFTSSWCFIPCVRHLSLFDSIDLAIRQGYLYRILEHGPQYRFLRPKEIIQECSGYHEPVSLSVIGCSGIGKTTGVMRVLSLYDQVIEHTEPFVAKPVRQVVYLKVETPDDGSVKTLCKRIIDKLGKLVEVDYYSEFVKDRLTLETLRRSALKLLEKHYVGLLVIDEVQNLVHSRKNREELFNFIVSLSNEICVPILYVGTPKVLRLMQSNLRTARRFGSLGSYEWSRFNKDQGDEWEFFLRNLWKYQVLANENPLCPSAAIADEFYRCSQGILDILLKLFILAQMEAILRSSKKNNKEPVPERLTPSLIAEVFEANFKNIKPIIEALRDGDERALEAFEDVRIKDSVFKKKIEEYYQQIEDATEQMPSNQYEDDAMTQMMVRFREMCRKDKEMSETVGKLKAKGMDDRTIVSCMVSAVSTEEEVPEQQKKTLSEDFEPKSGTVQ